MILRQTLYAALGATIMLAACLDSSPVQSLYECTAVYACDGELYEVFPQRVCQADDPSEDWRAALQGIEQKTECNDEYFMTECNRLGPCVNQGD